ncbi:MAG: hypothetical protein JO252_26210 [Planctomycetaceae bacterium]|nr:hypothetical protein [Planctomycetaceae bacterium]
MLATPALLSRVVSRPLPNRLCLDLGHKAVAADPVGSRVALLDILDAALGGRSEEHRVVETPHPDRFSPGTSILAPRTYVCPTCDQHDEGRGTRGERLRTSVRPTCDQHRRVDVIEGRRPCRGVRGLRVRPSPYH